MAGHKLEHWEAKLRGMLTSENSGAGSGLVQMLTLLIEKLRPRAKKELTQGHMALVATLGLEFWFAVLCSFSHTLPLERIF